VLTALLAIIATTHGFASPRSRTTKARPSTFLQGAIVARNGLSYEDVEIGTGRNIFPGDLILCYYVGTYDKSAGGTGGGDNAFFSALTGGNKVTFDETDFGEPAEVVIGKGQVIKGWDIGICGDQSLEIPAMKIGGDRKLIIPAALAYGERGAGDVIPPDTDLEFQIEILNAERGDPGVSGELKLKAFGALFGFLGFMLIAALVVASNSDFLLALLKPGAQDAPMIQ
jgi:FKBP-type peptidyl-prolyl cis-trans isomerase FkpA